MKSWLTIWLLVATVGLASCGKSKQEVEEEAKQLAAAQKVEADKKQAEDEEKLVKKKIKRFQDQLLTNLKDPDSAQFKNLRLSKGKGGEALCGEFNAKNSYGGYIGFRPFAVTEKKMADVDSTLVVPLETDHALTAMAKIKIYIPDAGCK